MISDKIVYHIYRRVQCEERYPVMTLLFSKSIDKAYLAGELNPDVDKDFRADDKCNGCAICARICPVGNIQMVDDGPVWQHRCQKCLACIQWCPKESIQFKNVTLKRKRYHHPEVKLSDMLKRGE